MKKIIFYLIMLLLFNNYLFSSTVIDSKYSQAPKWVQYVTDYVQLRKLYPRKMPIVEFYSFDLSETAWNEDWNEDIDNLGKYFINESKLNGMNILRNIIISFVNINDIYTKVLNYEEYGFKIDKYLLSVLPYLEEEDIFWITKYREEKYMANFYYLFLIDYDILADEFKKIIDKLAIDFNHRTVSKEELKNFFAAEDIMSSILNY